MSGPSLLGLPLLAGGVVVLAAATLWLLARPGGGVAAARSPWSLVLLAEVLGLVPPLVGALALRELGFGVASASALAAEAAVGAAIAGAAALVGLRHHWRAAAVGALAALGSAVVGYLAHATLVSLPALLSRRHSLHSLSASLVLSVAEAASLALVVLHAFYALDACGRRRWGREPHQVPFDPCYQPKVAVQVTVFNEPREVVAQTLRHLQALDYPPDRLLLMVLDDSTDERLARFVARECRKRGISYLHRDDRRGFKAGALNDALDALSPDVEIVGVVDADFQVDPAWLRETVGHFVDPRLAFLQTPQAYRNMEESFLTRQYGIQDAFFYASVMPSRNEADSIIFCGTMGLVRRRALEAAGGWSERHICEDAEMAFRLLDAGASALYVPRVYGRGLAPSSFSAYKKQQFRWAFGNVRVALTHARRLWRSPMPARRKLDFLVGFLHWFDGVFVLAIAACLAALGFGYVAGVDVVSHHRGEAWLLALVPMLLLGDSVLRVHAALRQGARSTVRATLAVMGLWCSIKLNNARAALLALARDDLPFVRTPRARDGPASTLERARRALQQAREEAVAALVLVVAAAAAGVRTVLLGAPEGALLDVWLLVGWLAFYALVLACGPLYAYAAIPSAGAAGVHEHKAPGPRANLSGWPEGVRRPGASGRRAAAPR